MTDSTGNISTSAIETDLLIGRPLADISVAVALALVESREKTAPQEWREEVELQGIERTEDARLILALPSVPDAGD